MAVGPEFRLKETNFFWGIEGIIGYSNNRQTFRQTIYTTNDDGSVNSLISLENFLDGSISILEQVERSHLVPGVQGRFAFNGNASKNISFQLFASLSFEYGLNLSTTSRAEDGFNFLNPEPSHTINLFSKLVLQFLA